MMSIMDFEEQGTRSNSGSPPRIRLLQIFFCPIPTGPFIVEGCNMPVNGFVHDFLCYNRRRKTGVQPYMNVKVIYLF